MQSSSSDSFVDAQARLVKGASGTELRKLLLNIESDDIKRKVLKAAKDVPPTRNVPILYAKCALDNIEGALILLEHGADPNETYAMNDRTPLHCAVRLKSERVTELIDALIAAGASLRAVDRYGRNAFHEACDAHNVVSVRHLLKFTHLFDIDARMYPVRLRRKASNGVGFLDEMDCVALTGLQLCARSVCTSLCCMSPSTYSLVDYILAKGAFVDENVRVPMRPWQNGARHRAVSYGRVGQLVVCRKFSFLSAIYVLRRVALLHAFLADADALTELAYRLWCAEHYFHTQPCLRIASWSLTRADLYSLLPYALERPVRKLSRRAYLRLVRLELHLRLDDLTSVDEEIEYRNNL